MLKQINLLLAASALFLAAPGLAQEAPKGKDKGKKEIIIRGKEGKPEKMTIVIDGDQVTINGKDIDQYEGGDVIIRKRELDELHRNLEGHMREMERQGRELEGQMAPYAFHMPRMKMRTPNPWVDMHPMPRIYFNEDPATPSGKPVAQLGVMTEKQDKGLVINEIMKGSAAEKAGLQEGDIITALDGRKITDPESLATLVREHKPGDEVELTYTRDKKTKKQKVKLGESRSGSTKSFNFKIEEPEMWKEDWPLMAPVPGPEFGRAWGAEFSRPKLGIKVEELEDASGVKILYVEEGSPAEKAGLKKDDVITHIGNQKVQDIRSIGEAMRENREKGIYPVTVNRNGSPFNVEVRIPKKLQKTDL